MWLVASASIAGNLPVQIDNGEYIVGRSRQGHVVLSDSTVSRQHARLVRTRNEVTIEDLVSSNGTYVNGHRVERCRVQFGDRLRFGGVTCAMSSSPLGFQPHGDETCTLLIRQEHCCSAQSKTFSAAQQEVIDRVMDGLSEAEIAAMLGKSPHTVHTQLKAIFKQVGVHSRAELIVTLMKPK